MNYVDKFNVLGAEVRQRPCIKVTEKPTTATAEMVGELRLYENPEDLSNIVYVCVHEGGDYFWKQLGSGEGLENKIDRNDIVTDYNEWLENQVDTDFDEKVPSIGVIYNFFEFGQFLSEGNIKPDISSDADGFIYTDIPNAEAVKSYVDAQMNIAPEQELPAVLESNKEYNFGVINNAVLLFPEESNDGDVIYVVFTAGTSEDTVDIAINKDFTSGLTDFVPEAGKKYEIYGRYDSRDAIWLCGYSEY